MLIGSLSLFELHTISLDSRLKWAPSKPSSPNIVVIRLTPYDLKKWKYNRNILAGSSALIDSADEFYWEEALWADLINQILKSNPQKIGIALYLGASQSSEKNRHIFQDPRVLWAVPKKSDPSLLPSFTLYNHENVGEISISEDPDGFFRRYQADPSYLGDFFEKLTNSKQTGTLLKMSYREKQINIIDAFHVLAGNVPTSEFENKIILIGRSLNETSRSYKTPLSPFSRLGLTTLIADNWIHNKWIKFLPISFYLFYYLILGILILGLIIRYPHKVAFVFLFFLALILIMLSTSVFDLQGIWLPILGPLVQILTTWVLFMGYSLNKMEKQTLSLKEEKRLIKKLDELKINFVSLISHDLKTPIAKIQAVIQKLENSSLQEAELTELNKINSYSKELNRYIQNVLKLLQIESSQFQIQSDSVDINELLQRVWSELSPLANTRNISCQFDLTPLFSIEGDEKLLSEILVNLIQNAIQYSQSSSQIQIATQEESDYVIIRIRDQGDGIDKDELPFLFEKFYRGKKSSLSQQGSGLGLFLVKYFVELHHGKIYMESEINKGTLVTVWLPVQQPTSPKKENL